MRTLKIADMTVTRIEQGNMGVIVTATNYANDEITFEVPYREAPLIGAVVIISIEERDAHDQSSTTQQRAE